MGENASVKIDGGDRKGCYLYIVKIQNFHPVLTSSLSLNLHICFRLVKLGIDVNTRHELGWTAIHVAAINGNVR